jgi:2-haloacid dehalogenase
MDSYAIDSSAIDSYVIDVVAFDVNETLFSLAGLEPVFASVGLDRGLVPLWFARVLRDGFALTAAGDFRPFGEVAIEALIGVDPRVVSRSQAEEVLAAFRTLDPYPDVEPAFRRLADAGVRMVTLTNGAASVTEALLERSGLSSYVERALSVEAVRRWKPAPDPYHYAATTCSVPPSRMALVAAHSWDCDGARRAGLRTGWVSRLEVVRPSIFLEADVSGPDLTAVVDGLLTLPAQTA